MRPWFLLLGLSLLLLHTSKLNAADPPVPWDPGVAWPAQGVPAAQPPSFAPVLVPQAVGPQWLDVEFLLGLPTEVRVQGTVYRGQNAAFMLEGIAGIEILPVVAFIIPIPFAGVGGRLRYAPCNGERDAFVVEPGLDVYAIPGANFLAGGVDVELLWYHNWGRRNRFGFEMGADLGAFFGHSQPGFWAWPMVSGVFGLHF